jgi:hypothetical protein
MVKHVNEASMHREELRDRPGNLPTPFMIALAEVAAESTPNTAVTNILGGVMMLNQTLFGMP